MLRWIVLSYRCFILIALIYRAHKLIVVRWFWVNWCRWHPNSHLWGLSKSTERLVWHLAELLWNTGKTPLFLHRLSKRSSTLLLRSNKATSRNRLWLLWLSECRRLSKKSWRLRLCCLSPLTLRLHSTRRSKHSSLRLLTNLCWSLTKNATLSRKWRLRLLSESAAKPRRWRCRLSE